MYVGSTSKISIKNLKLALFSVLVTLILLIILLQNQYSGIDDNPLANLPRMFFIILCFWNIAILSLLLLHKNEHFNPVFLLLIILQAFIIRITPHLKYTKPWWLGYDLMNHFGVVKDILTLNHLLEYGNLHYTLWPIYDTLVAMFKMVTDISIFTSFKIIPVISAIYSLCFYYLLIFTLSRDKKLSLLATYILSIMDFHMLYTLQPVQQPFSQIFSLMLLYIYVKYITDNATKPKNTLLFVLIGIVLIMTHILSPLFTFLILLFVLIFAQIADIGNCQRNFLPIVILLLLILSYLFYVTFSFSGTIIGKLYQLIAILGGTGKTITELTHRSIHTFLMINIQKLYLAPIVVFTYLYLINLLVKRQLKIKNPLHVTLIMTSLLGVFFGTAVFVHTALFGRLFFSPERYLIYFYYFISPPIAFMLVAMLRRTKKPRRKKQLFVISVAILFISIIMPLGIYGEFMVYASFKHGGINFMLDDREFVASQWLTNNGKLQRYQIISDATNLNTYSLYTGESFSLLNILQGSPFNPYTVEYFREAVFEKKLNPGYYVISVRMILYYSSVYLTIVSPEKSSTVLIDNSVDYYLADNTNIVYNNNYCRISLALIP